MRRTLFILYIFLSASSIIIAGERGKSTPDNALKAYLHNHDKSFIWTIDDTHNGDGVSTYRIILISQQWHGIIWKHELTIIVPDTLKYRDALLFITGGSLKDGKPNIHKWNEDLITSLSGIARTNMCISAILWQVPNQPLFDDLTEDALISYTLHNYLDDHDLTWPLLFPMTKSAIRAMDAIQKFSRQELRFKVRNFVISGASKRGWTTWLTGANDRRVKAIGPMVIDVLNMPVNVDYQKVVWGDYSIEIEDYVKLGIAQQLGTENGDELVKMIDPYSYRKKLTMPKMIFIGTNDAYWPVDAIKNYIDSIPGDNHICYTPNAGHDLGDKKTAFAALNALMGTTVTGRGFPPCDYTADENNGTVVINIKTDPDIVTSATLWSADSGDRDFRDEKFTSSPIALKNKPEFTVEIRIPDKGYRAFYVDLKCRAPYGDDYTQSTRMFVTDNHHLLLYKK